ncbi:uncharacterized protein K452DRAFT_307372 [Aplosporella prunicola CBS 121167]|uniref:Uncharacterized protein n=1 Tax=Aplosporella prunicola CBS 121167 TaxID=1176127 RepID=A0A6A6BKV6_9PEZI|nr:uncharacterized protein K452DRAFT_307372 [Aplosporella prunicola CBS 121167]KAF2143201.1 hypothetical protein K452DRAFT_307372 [Aplosporella prunicola CBS 121167]
MPDCSSETEKKGPILWSDIPRDDTKRYRESFESTLTHQTIKEGTRIPPNAPEPSRNRLTSSSFGDNGTTASVNAFGHIMQISRYFGHGKSGFYCVDLGHVPEPYLVQSRNQELADLCESPEEGIRLKISGSPENLWEFTDVRPTVDYLYDRWPRYTLDNHKLSKLSIQYFCNSGIVFQRYQLKSRSTSSSIPQFQQLTIDLHLLIRNLDFVDRRNNFNEADLLDSGYSYRKGPHCKSIIITHQLKSADGDTDAADNTNVRLENQQISNEKAPKFVGLVITAFSKGSAQSLKTVSPSESPYVYEIDLDKAHRKELQTSGSLEITLAYRMQMMSDKEPWESSLIPAKTLQAMGRHFSSENYELYNSTRRLRFSTNAHLDFITRRNLEHILSVCRIPIPQNPVWKDVPKSPDGGETAVALTCGDMSGHRLTSTTSFFAFQFLLFMYKYLESLLKNENPLKHSHTPNDCLCEQKSTKKCKGCTDLMKYINTLKDRIHSTCKAHVTWLFKKTGPSTDQFLPHYWATGMPIKGWEKNYYLSFQPLTDTAFQIIKVRDFDTITGTKESLHHKDKIEDRIRA